MVPMLIALLLACPPEEPKETGDTAPVDRGPAILALTGDTTSGGNVFGGYCTSCHGYGGEGDIGPAMADVIPGATLEHLVDVVLNGWDSDEISSQMFGMPSLSDQEIADVTAYALATWGP